MWNLLQQLCRLGFLLPSVPQEELFVMESVSLKLTFGAGCLILHQHKIKGTSKTLSASSLCICRDVGDNKSVDIGVPKYFGIFVPTGLQSLAWAVFGVCYLTEIML